MERWASISVGVGAVALAVAITAKAFHVPIGQRTEPAARAEDSGILDGGWARGQRQPSAATVTPSNDFFPGEALRGDSGPTGFVDGTPVPPLPISAPRQVRFGIVLVSYSGAEAEASGARPVTRSRADAKALAEKLAAAAPQDFHAAVEQGDPGSADDIGTVKVGILEPAAEYVLFMLPVGGIGGPVDTPRGYWIVKRLESPR
jgi:PPIC-type PPIASE domain